MPVSKDVTKEYAPLFKAIGENSKKLFYLAEKASDAIGELVVQEEVTHDELKSVYKLRYKSEIERVKNAPIEVDIPQIDLKEFYQKLGELKQATVEKKIRDEELKQKIAENREQIALAEEALRKKLEFIYSAKELFN